MGKVASPVETYFEVTQEKGYLAGVFLSVLMKHFYHGSHMILGLVL